MTRKKRGIGFGWIAPFILVGFVVAAYSAYWLYMRGELEKGVLQWIDAERAAGRTIAYDAMSLTGYPYRFALKLDAPVYGDEAGRWSAEQLELVMQPWDWNHVIARSPGANRVDLGGDVYTAVLGDASAGSLSWDETGLNRFSLSLDEARLTDATGADYGANGFELHLRPAPDTAETLQVVLQWDGLSLPMAPPDAPYLGTELQASRALLELTKAYPVLASGGGVRDWTAGEGRAELAQLLLNWGPLQFGSKADLGFDASGRATGIVEVRIDDGEALRRAVLDAGLPLDEFAQLSMAITALDAASQEGRFLPLTVRDGEVRYLGQTLAEIPPLP